MSRKSIFKLEVGPKRAPQAVQTYSNMFYDTNVAPIVAIEAEKQGLTINDIKLINTVTSAEWKKETPEVRAEVKQVVKQEKQLMLALKECHYDDIRLSPEQKDTYVTISVPKAERFSHRYRMLRTLGFEFRRIFDKIKFITGWGFVIVGAGIDPLTGDMRSRR